MLNNLDYTGKIKRIEDDEIVIQLNEPLNIERLQTVYEGFSGDRQADVRIRDPRGFSPEQRAFTFALLNDIYSYTGQPFESLKDVFYWKYKLLTGKTISLADMSENTKDDIALLDNIILDFIFENHVPFKKGYEILPQNRQYYFYKCITSRTCCNCGKQHADIHHVDAVGMGNNRKKIDNTNRRFMALCRECHQRIHAEGFTEFTKKRHLEAITLNQESLKRLGLNIIGRNLETD
ncbi:putative HNHc nuclease [Tetragenococcus halophilus]|uniref:putative HNHc nuclease n=1 Tax=Tetragenococcus halophilus TaxID=51669 RepID=UPI0030C93EEC